MRMAQFDERTGLADESLGRFGIVLMRRVRKLDDDFGLQIGVPGDIHAPHAAFAELPLDRVTPLAERRADPTIFGWPTHRTIPLIQRCEHHLVAVELDFESAQEAHPQQRRRLVHSGRKHRAFDVVRRKATHAHGIEHDGPRLDDRPVGDMHGNLAPAARFTPHSTAIACGSDIDEQPVSTTISNSRFSLITTVAHIAAPTWCSGTALL